MAIVIEHNVPITETRGRPPSEEHMQLLQMQIAVRVDGQLIGDSFVSSKRREALYQLARSMGIKVHILAENEDCTKWRIWKTSKQIKPKRRPKRALNNQDEHEPTN